VLRVLEEPQELPGRHFDGLVWEHRPLGPALATLLTGRDVFVHRRACDSDAMDANLPTLATLLEMRGVEVGETTRPATRPRFAFGVGLADDPGSLTISVAPNGVWLPDRTRRVGGLVRLIDVSATVLDAFGFMDLGWEHGLQGQSLLELVDDNGTWRECYLTDCTRRGWRTPAGAFWEPDLPEELAARMRGYVRRRLAESGLVDPLLRLGPETPAG
jgi:hypothetical protein